MEKGWQCPVCGAGVAPDRHHCEHPVQADKLPEDFPDKSLREAAALMYAELDIEQEAAKFRMHYATERSGRWQHVWGKWLDGERKWIKSKTGKAVPDAMRGRPFTRSQRVRIWARTIHGTRFESSMELSDYERAAAAGQPPELVDESELPRLQALARALRA